MNKVCCERNKHKEMIYYLRTIFSISVFIILPASANMLPVFTHDMNNLALSESTPVDTVVYKLQVDPEGLRVSISS